MLSGVQQYPDLSCWRPRENAREYASAPNAGVMLLDRRVLHGTGSVQRQVVMRINGRGLTLKIRARSAWLNPEFHSGIGA
jgi:hypothetical protein